MSVNIGCDGCGKRLGELRGGTRDDRVVSELTKVDSDRAGGGGIPPGFRVNHLCQGCTAAVLAFLAERRERLAEPPGKLVRPGTNTGHGWVWARPDGFRNLHCGGPAICSQCKQEETAAALGVAMEPHPASGSVPEPEPGPCADAGCPVLHDDPANPVHPPGYVAATVGGNAGHGWVWARPDGMKARCGGPGICSKCSRDQAAVQMGNAMAAEQASS